MRRKPVPERGEASFVYRGPIVPAVRMTRRGKYNDRRAQLYLAVREAIAHFFALNWPYEAPLNTRAAISTRARIYVRSPARADGDNLLKTVWDAANRILWTDDRYILRFEAGKYPAATEDEEGFDLRVTWAPRGAEEVE
jgi:Holliday junction resolvase RusA-like endonuclease